MTLKRNYGYRFITLLCLSLLCLAAGNISPHKNARERFATNFFYKFSSQVQSSNGFIVNSPAALQKLLAVFYNITSVEFAVGLTRDMALRDFITDLDLIAIELLRRLVPKIFSVEAINNMHLIEPLAVLNYFEHDFAELRNEIMFENYFLLHSDANISPTFAASVLDYCNVHIVHKHLNSGLELPSLNVLSYVSYVAQLGPNFYTENGLHQAYGKFKYRELLIVERGVFPAKIVELPLVSLTEPMTMLLIMPLDPANLQPMIERFSTKLSFSAISRGLRERRVAVSFPFLNLLTRINYSNYLKKMSFLTLHKLFHARVELYEIFENECTSSVHVRQFIQLINLQVKASGHSALKKNKHKSTNLRWNASNNFDASESPFIFVIRSSRVVYFMGLYDVDDFAEDDDDDIVVEAER